MSPTRVSATLAALGLACVLSLAGAAPAVAGTTPRAGTCVAGAICAFEFRFFEGGYTGGPAVAPGDCLWVHGGYESVMNNTSSTEYLWSGSDCTGQKMYILPGARYNAIQFTDGTVGAAIGGFP